MSLAGVASVFDRYRITLVGTGAATILDLAGNALDGEPIRLLPSGDGTAGGDYTATFSVAGTLATLHVDSDERVHAAVLRLPQRRRRESAGRAST